MLLAFNFGVVVVLYVVVVPVSYCLVVSRILSGLWSNAEDLVKISVLGGTLMYIWVFPKFRGSLEAEFLVVFCSAIVSKLLIFVKAFQKRI